MKHYCSVSIIPLQHRTVVSSLLSGWAATEGSRGAGTFFGQGGTENIKYKFRFAKKWPIICINQ